ncbi:MAG: periplasmic heavy metal sensor [Phycisphaerae bacterium]|nr:periplasmic heavy metal sensor [Phycisphaerae bacterium]
MKHLSVIGIVTAALVAGSASYIFARYTSDEIAAQARPPMSHLLSLSAQQEQAINEADPSFHTDAARLASDLDAVQENLACLLEDPATDRQVAMATIEKMMLAHNALERRVAEHVLEVREHLEPQQRKSLMGLMSERVRTTRNRMQRCRWGWGRISGKGCCGGQGACNGCCVGQGGGSGGGSGQGAGNSRGGGQGGGKGGGGRTGLRDGTGPRKTE